VYVGSHNLSVTAWGGPVAEGKPAKKPNNVELGVVLATRSVAQVAEWRRRAPLRCESAVSYAAAAANAVGTRDLDMVQPFVRGGMFYKGFANRANGVHEFHEAIRGHLVKHRSEERRLSGGK
jgi:hypothetical protein